MLFTRRQPPTVEAGAHPEGKKADFADLVLDHGCPGVTRVKMTIGNAVAPASTVGLSACEQHQS